LYLRFKDFKARDYTVERMLANNGAVDEREDQNEVDNHIMEVGYKTYLQNDLHFWSGLVLGFYRIVALATLLITVQSIG
jgi:membrane protein required for beta-lactamase induction